MKNYILILLMALLLTACSKKSDVKPVTPLTPLTATDANLVGKWTLTADSIFTTQNGLIQIIVAPIVAKEYTQFNSNGTGADIDSNATSATFDYTISNGVLQFIFKNSDGSNMLPENLTVRAISTNTLIISEVSDNNRTDITFSK